MIEYIVLSIVIATFLIASIEDIKKREVYDYINYSLAFLIIIIAIFDSMINSTLDPIKYTGFGILIGFALGSLLYYIGIWGGGDAKFLIGFSASIYYLRNFINKEETLYLIFTNLTTFSATIFKLFLESLRNYILILDGIFLLLIILQIIKSKNFKMFKSRFTLFTIIFLLLIGLYFHYSNFILILIGFASFLLIFFGDEDCFHSIYFKITKKIKNLKENEIPDSSIIENNKTIINYEDSKDGLTKEHIHILNEQIKENDKSIYLRKILPYSILVILNYLLYILKIISINETNIEILGFLFKFLLISFFVGAVIGILMLIYYYTKNFKKIKITFKKSEYIYFAINLLIPPILFAITKNTTTLILLLLIPVYFFVKILRKIEGHMFIKQIDLNNVTYGDWIAQDIKIKNKVIYTINDFKLGINEKQLENLKTLSKKHKELKKIYVKDGLAFLPPLFIGFIITILI
ncbi:MAG: A24 family peptidase [Candidatus Woesearchaeota archaeon]|jgi:Flp pilus assembly protein protease CpaA|nr:A24 family peptidase [Candidatus Woesearchaeota archaeon]